MYTYYIHVQVQYVLIKMSVSLPSPVSCCLPVEEKEFSLARGVVIAMCDGG